MSEAPRERLLTAPLLVFLVLVASIVGYAVTTRHPSPDLDGAIELLADGDLDSHERRRMLQRTLDLAQSADSPRQRWAGLLAAVALEDRQAFAGFEARLGEAPGRILADELWPWLSLGDPLLANLLSAMLAEAQKDADSARGKWRQVAAQARMTGNHFAGDLATAASKRLN